MLKKKNIIKSKKIDKKVFFDLIDSLKTLTNKSINFKGILKLPNSVKTKKNFYAPENKDKSVKEDIIAIEISNDRVFIAQLSGSINDWQLSKFDYTHFENPIDFDDINSRKYASRVISGLLNRNNIKTKSVALCVSLSNAIIRTVQSPLMTDEELKEAIKTKTLWENLIEIDNINFDEYSIYHQVINKNTESNTMEILFVASKVSDIEKIIQIAIESSLKPVVIDVKCFTYKNALDINKFVSNDTEDTTAILNIGSDENYLMVIQGNNNRITEIFATPEELASFKENENAPSASFPFLDRYCLQVEQAITEFNSIAKKSGKKLVTTIEVSSPINALPSIIANLSKHIPTCEIRVLNIFDLITIPEQLKTKLSSLNNPSIAASIIGLASRKLDVFGYYKFIEAVRNVNLLPDRERLIDQTIRKKRMKLSLIICFIFFIISSFIYFKAHQNIANKHNLSGKENLLALKEYEIIISKIKKVNKENKSIEEATQSMQKVSSNQKQSYDILISIKNASNSEMVIDEISYETLENVKVLGRAKTDSAIVLFMDELRTNKEFLQVTIDNMSSDKTTKIKNFTISCTIEIKQE